MWFNRQFRVKTRKRVTVELNSNFVKQHFCSTESYIKYVGEKTGSKLFPVLISQFDNQRVYKFVIKQFSLKLSILSMLLIIVQTVVDLATCRRTCRGQYFFKSHYLNQCSSDLFIRYSGDLVISEAGSVFNRVAGTEHSFYLFPCNNFVGGGSESHFIPVY